MSRLQLDRQAARAAAERCVAQPNGAVCVEPLLGAQLRGREWQAEAVLAAQTLGELELQPGRDRRDRRAQVAVAVGAL